MEWLVFQIFVACVIGVLVFKYLLPRIPDDTIRMLVQLLLVVLAIFWLLRVGGFWRAF